MPSPSRRAADPAASRPEPGQTVQPDRVQIGEEVTTGSTPGAPQIGVPPTPGTTTIVRADPRDEYLAGVALNQTWYLNLARSLPARQVDDKTELADETYDAMLTDPQVAASINVFKAAVLETGPILAPALDDEDDPASAQSLYLADWCEAILADLATPLDDVLWNLADAYAHGQKLGELVYDTSDAYGAPPRSHRPALGELRARAAARSPDQRQAAAAAAGDYAPPGGPQLILRQIKVKPRHAYGFLVDAYENILGILGLVPGQYYPIMPGMVYADIEQIPNLLPLEKFALFTFRPKDADPRGTTMLRPAYQAWWTKQHLWTEYGKFLAQLAGGLLVGKPDPAAEPQQIQDEDGQPTGAVTTPEEVLLQTLIKARNGAVLVVPAAADVAVHYPPAGAGSPFLLAFQLLNLEITKAILHVTLATEEGKNQARAAAETHADVLGVMIRQAKGAMERLIRGVLRRMVQYNFGPEAVRLTPRVSLGDVESADKAKLWTAVGTLAAANYFAPDQLPQVDHQIGLPVRLATAPEPDAAAVGEAQPRLAEGTAPVPAPPRPPSGASAASAPEAPTAARA